MATLGEIPLQPKRAASSHFGDAGHDFSLVLGGPLFQIFRRSHLSGDALELLGRRVIVITVVAWVPLLLLCFYPPPFGAGALKAFLRDVEVHTRFLVALPVLIIAELIVHSRLTPLVRRFVERRIVIPADLPRFDQAVQSAIGLRNSTILETALLLFVYVVGLQLWGYRIPIVDPTWYALPGGRWHLTAAGYWYVFVSIPIAQFILLRWYVRLFIWFRFLWNVSGLNLHLVPTHPDKCGGLAFLGTGSFAYGPLLFAQGAMLAGVIASRVLYHGQKLISFKLQIGGIIAFFVFAVLCPLLMFTPQLARTKRCGLAEYGQIAQDYVDQFEQKWVPKAGDKPEELLGSGDIQSLADLGNSYSVVSEMRCVPIKLNDITRLAASAAAPFLPLLLTVFSLEELIMRIIGAIF